MFETVLRSPFLPFTRRAQRSLSWLGALYALGCSSQVTPDYRGEPMAVLQGALAADGAFEMPADGDGMMVGLVWLVGSPNGEREPLVAEVAQTEGEFPFGFTLSVFGPPSPEAQTLRCGPAGCSEPQPQPDYLGFVAALREGADLEHLQSNDILGLSLEHGVFYFERDANLDDPTDLVAANARIYNVPATRGYHLFSIRKNRELYAELRRCEANGLCVQSKGPGGDAGNSDADRRFEECLSLVPDATTCTYYPSVCRAGATDASGCQTYFEELGIEPTASELEEHERCQALQDERWQSLSCELPESPWQFPGNPLGFDAEISIQLGAGLYEWMN